MDNGVTCPNRRSLLATNSVSSSYSVSGRRAILEFDWRVHLLFDNIGSTSADGGAEGGGAYSIICIYTIENPEDLNELTTRKPKVTLFFFFLTCARR